MQIIYWADYIDDMSQGSLKTLSYSKKLSVGLPMTFVIHDPVEFGYFSAFLVSRSGQKVLLDLYLVEQGDSVLVNVEQFTSAAVKNGVDSEQAYNIVFTGSGSEKYNCRFNIDNAILNISALDNPTIDHSGNYNLSNYQDIAIKEGLTVLGHWQSRMTSEAVALIQSDLIGKLTLQKFDVVTDSIFSKNCAAIKHAFELQLDSLICKNNAIISKSAYLPQALLIVMRMKWSVENVNSEFIRYLQQQVRIFHSSLRDRVLTNYYFSKFCRDYELIESESTISSPKYFRIVRDYSRHLSKGSIPYNFTLPDTEGRKVRLSDFKGKVIVIDFWFTGCRGCVKFNEKIAKVKESFSANKNIVFLSICVDRDKKLWLNSVRQGLYTDETSINLFTAGLGESHPLIQHYFIGSYPFSLLINHEFKTAKTKLHLLSADDIILLAGELLKMPG